VDDADDGSAHANGIRGGITEPAHRGDERVTVLGMLQRQRDLVEWKLRGAADDTLASAATPTGMTAAGLVRHLTNVERHWLRDVFAGQDGLSYDWTADDPDGEWRVPAGTAIAQLLADYAAETALCDTAVQTAALDDVAARRDMSLRWILLHLIEETARHLGHLDLLREQADGETGEDPGD
jgi:uncharacterized damage-inducible protein DinB